MLSFYRLYRHARVTRTYAVQAEAHACI